MKAEGAMSGNDAWAAITGWLVRAVFGTLVHQRYRVCRRRHALSPAARFVVARAAEVVGCCQGATRDGHHRFVPLCGAWSLLPRAKPWVPPRPGRQQLPFGCRSVAGRLPAG